MATWSDRCPFLFPVTADSLWMYPVSGFCRRPDAPVRVPAPSTVMRVCTTCEHARCPGFVAAPHRGARPGSRCRTATTSA
ncbi:MAG TPA: hypothetical protein VF197_19485 [Methylomirabilota bacterium]|jgi:hypothetical protein